MSLLQWRTRLSWRIWRSLMAIKAAASCLGRSPAGINLEKARACVRGCASADARKKRGWKQVRETWKGRPLSPDVARSACLPVRPVTSHLFHIAFASGTSRLSPHDRITGLLSGQPSGRRLWRSWILSVEFLINPLPSSRKLRALKVADLPQIGNRCVSVYELRIETARINGGA